MVYGISTFVFKMSVFKSEDSLETRVRVLEKKVKELERFIGKDIKVPEPKVENEEDDDVCLIS